MKTRLWIWLIVAGLCVARVTPAADINVEIPGGSSSKFNTRVYFNYDQLDVGGKKTLRVYPAQCYRFSATPTTRGDANVSILLLPGHDGCQAEFDVYLISGKEGWAYIDGNIEPDNNACGCSASAGGGAGPPPTGREFEIEILNRLAWAHYTTPANGTNLTVCACSTNDIAVKVVLGDLSLPSSGTVTWTPALSNLGSVTPASIALSGGNAATKFYAGTDGATGTLTANATDLTFANGNPVSSVSTNITVNVVNVDMEIYLPKVIDSTEAMILDADELTKGGVTFVNLDNDDNDVKFDSVDDEVDSGDDELVHIKLKVKPNTLAVGNVTLTATAGGASVKIWQTNKKKTGTGYTLGTAMPVNPTKFAVEGDYLVTNFWVEGISPHTAAQGTKLKMEYDSGTCKVSDEVALTVIGVDKVEWVGRNNSVSDNNTLDADPNWPSGLAPGGLRVFPDARFVSGAVETSPRNKVDVKVTLSCPPPQPIKVYLKWFDVDDPTSDTGPVDDPGAVTNETVENDNRGTGAEFTAPVLGGGVKEVAFAASTTVKEQMAEFTVTMQPGDNFRVVANGDVDFLSHLENKDPDLHAGGGTPNADKQRITNIEVKAVGGTPDAWEVREAGKYCSLTLTVWRFLHVEVDSMAAVPVTGAEKNTVDGNITAITAAAGVAKDLTLDVNLRTDLTPQDNSKHLSDATPDNGRFEKGWIKIGANAVQTADLDGNGDTFVRKVAGIDIPSEIHQGGVTVNSGKVTALAGSVFTITVNLGTTLYIGASFQVAGTAFTISTNTATTVTVTAGAPQIPFVLHDDDDDTIFNAPRNPDTSDLERAFKPAFVKPLFDLANAHAVAPFVLNVNTETNASAYASTIRATFEFDNVAQEANPTFWTVYLLGAFQPGLTSDADPDAEGAVLGTVDTLNGQGANIFLESLREITATATVNEKYTVSHEIGHLFNGSHDPVNGFDGGLMDQSSVRTSVDFTENTLNKIRRISHP